MTSNNNHYNPYAWIADAIADALTSDGCLFFDNGDAVKVEGVAPTIAAGKILNALNIVTPTKANALLNNAPTMAVHEWGMALAEADRALTARFNTSKIRVLAEEAIQPDDLREQDRGAAESERLDNPSREQ